MEYRVYTYRPGRPQQAPAYQRRRYKKRRSSILTLCLFTGTALLMALLLFVQSSEQAETGTPDTAAGADTHFAPILPSASSAGTPEDAIPTPAELDAGSHTEYDFSSPVPASDPVENSYFDDAVFIGDSRTEGLILNCGLVNTTSYAYKGLMVDTVFTKPVINKNGQKVSVMDALKSTSFSKVYIMLGVNETGWVYSQVFQSKYGEVIDGIREINPEAEIYIQELMPVSDRVSSTHSYITNAKINEYNALLRELAEDKQVYCIDTGRAVASADGSLPDEAAHDGIHLVKAYCEKWLDYLKTHTVGSQEEADPHGIISDFIEQEG